MLLNEQEFVMGSTSHNKKPPQYGDHKGHDDDPKGPPSPPSPPTMPGQSQSQTQNQGQNETQYAVQSLDSKSRNDNDNDNKNGNDNKNFNKNSNDNDVDNKLDNKTGNRIDNDLDNKVDNKVQNTVDNKVDVDVKVNVDLDLKADGLSSPVIDLHGINNIHDSVIMPDVVNQTLNGGGTQFNVDQVNNLVDNDHLSCPTVSFTGGDYPGGGLHMDAKAEGGDAKMDAKIGDVIGSSASGAVASADAAITQDAFNQTITQGANIQFNSITMQNAGHDLQDSHDLG